MFFLKDIERSITLHPSFFSRDIHARLSNQLLHDVEGTYQEDYFIVCVMENHEFTEGKVVPGSAVAEYRVHYRAIVWKPFKGEVVCNVTALAWHLTDGASLG
jgi:DNA-directed RNA polymerase II subunit RPB7